ncbi:MAG: hypothetical protein ABF768_03575 [Leuconostoc falkenbergense]|uniref:hypothetical protein n=1 Tax=Leuconostoc falkenbergense TaxID=2766470 RepID=UPI0039ED6CF8
MKDKVFNIGFHFDLWGDILWPIFTNIIWLVLAIIGWIIFRKLAKKLISLQLNNFHDYIKYICSLSPKENTKFDQTATDYVKNHMLKFAVFFMAIGDENIDITDVNENTLKWNDNNRINNLRQLFSTRSQVFQCI